MASFRQFRVGRRRGVAAIFHLVLLLCLATSGNAGDAAFRRHVINPESEYSAVAVLDVNHDGKQDILCGGFWYEAPTWQRHFVREVEHIRGRFDGYSHLPTDVNGDGWTDVITVNYRSSSIRWLQHPGADLGPWPMHTVEEPGPMETGRLFDIDGDGQLDVLPNGQQFAAWWSLERGTPPRWTRHELPPEVGGHGLGFGDINGDGRGDVIGPQGWAAAPQDRRNERWVWNREFDLGRASVPVLVVDVDEDGDNDLVWTSAHGFGAYWMEQTRTADETRQWTHHTIDTSWSQCHSPLWADMDGDGQGELVAGKRYMAHEGRDPGAYDPLVSYRYQFDSGTRTWHRWVISEGEHVGFGLDPKVVDLDGDGDLDLVVCGRSGLYWMENEGPLRGVRPNHKTPVYDDHSELMIVKDIEGVEKPVVTPFDWGTRRSHIAASIEHVLGTLPGPEERVPLDVQILQQRQVDDCTHQKISYQVEAGRRVKADVWLPKNDVSNAPGLIFVSQVAARNSSTAGSADIQTRNIPKELAERGYACIVLELSVRNEAVRGPQSIARLKEASFIDDIWTCVRAADLLESLPQVNGDRMGCVGNGLGARLALFTAALDQRIVATVCSGEIAIVGVESSASPSFAVPELIAAISPRALSLRTPSTMAAQEMKALEQAVQRASAVFGLNRTAQPPTIDAGALTDAATDARSQAYEWLDGRLKRRGFFGRPRSRQ